MVDVETIVPLLEELSSHATSFEQDQGRIVATFGAPVDAFDFDAALRALTACFSHAVPADAVGRTEACFVSLYEGVDGYSVGLAGFSCADPADAAWASEEPLWVHRQCADPSSQLDALCQSVDGDDGEAWPIALAVAIALVKAASPSLLGQWPTDSPPVLAVGFVDGDLYRIGHGVISG